ncbi:MAG: peptidoglycan DD-metalloendopeptidase family protein [Negativicoccus massiliensis]|uniref:murein hydrolase activator EnvC family protein n=1 Tax=Negativicoccus succinicivorans TaxID=620903 RepID=UPI0026F37A78|nr:M23 family metallopeptidase [Negativicoccus succinicivorans]MBS5887080.1 peptidoglycan DD-metalloendopeptidase family protein [Negativicoccus succinicivorans]MDU4641799.1 peptidoglycan DD-metalloendopeptidase family protein [Negativicoccus massiliensis]
MRRWKKGVAWLLIWAFCQGFAVPSLAENLEDELSDVQSQMNEAQHRKELAEEQIGSVSELLRQIQSELDVALNELHAIEVQQSQVNAQIQQTEVELAAAQKRLDERERILNKRLRDVYMHGKLNYLEVILGAKNFTDFANRLEFLKRIVSADLNLIAEIRAERELILQKKQQLEAQRQQLAQLQAEAEAKKTVVENKKQDQLIVLARLQDEKALAEASYAELQATSQDIEARIRARQQQGASAGQVVHGSGVFVWPTSGPITSPFGYRIHPIFGTQIYHSGIDIGVDTGTPIVAADSGVVIEADWLGGYGYAVVIDHGNGLSTLYGHNSELAVSPGQSVQQGQVIAYAGSTGYSTGPHCHFEVRVNGSPVDPMGYL